MTPADSPPADSPPAESTHVWVQAYIGWQIAGAYWIIGYGDVILRLTHLGASSFRFVIGNITYRRAVARRAELERVDDLVRSHCFAATPTLELRLLGAV